MIGYVREVRAGFEQAVSGLDHPPTDTALGYATGMKSGLDTTIITLEHLGRLTASAAQIDPASPGQPKPGFPTCPECGTFMDRTRGTFADRENQIDPNDLDAIFGNDGWIDLQAAQPDEPTPILVPQSEPRPLGMREGSKKHRVYEATRKLLEQNGPMHIDAMLEGVKALGVFEAVKDPRINFANILSALRSKGSSNPTTEATTRCRTERRRNDCLKRKRAEVIPDPVPPPSRQRWREPCRDGVPCGKARTHRTWPIPVLPSTPFSENRK